MTMTTGSKFKIRIKVNFEVAVALWQLQSQWSMPWGTRCVLLNGVAQAAAEKSGEAAIEMDRQAGFFPGSFKFKAT